MIFVSSAKPLSGAVANRLETLNELTNCLLLYCLFAFSGFQPGSTMRSDIGWLLIGIVIFHSSIHILVISCGTIKQINSKMKKMFAKYPDNKHVKRMEKIYARFVQCISKMQRNCGFCCNSTVKERLRKG